MATLYVVVGGAGTNSGVDEANAYTMAQGTANVAAGDDVNVKAGTYVTDDSTSSSIMDMDVAGTIANRIRWIAYTTTPGDFTIGDTPPVILNAATNSLANCVNATTITGSTYNELWGFQLTGATGHGLTGGTATDDITLYGCKVDGNGTSSGRGIQWDNGLGLIGCELTNNGLQAIDCDGSFRLINCIVHNETATVITTNSGTFVNNLFYNNGNGINVRNANGGAVFIGNTFDGDGQAGNVAIESSGSLTIPGLMLNNIFFDFNTAVNFANSGIEYVNIRANNLFFSNTTDYDNLTLLGSEIAGASDPFTNSGTRDYTLKSGSEAIEAGMDGSVVGFTSYIDIGARQLQPSAGGGSGQGIQQGLHSIDGGIVA